MLRTNTWDDLRHSHAKYGYVSRDPVEFIIQNHRALLQPAVSLKRIRYHTKDNMGVDTPTRQEFEQCERIEYTKIWARVQRAQTLNSAMNPLARATSRLATDVLALRPRRSIAASVWEILFSRKCQSAFAQARKKRARHPAEERFGTCSEADSNELSRGAVRFHKRLSIGWVAGDNSARL